MGSTASSCSCPRCWQRERHAGAGETPSASDAAKKNPHFSWAPSPMLLLRYLHTRPIRASSAAADLSSPQTREKEWARNSLVWVAATWPEVYFLTVLVMGTEAAVQNQGSHRLTDKHRGQGLRNHESCDATVLTLTTSRCPADRGSGILSQRWRERKRVLPVQRDPSEGSFSSRLGLQRPLCVATQQAAPSSHSGAPLHGARTPFPLRPRGSLKSLQEALAETVSPPCRGRALPP